MTTVSIHDASFITFIGIYPEERKVPNRIVCSMEVDYATSEKSDINTTVDYTVLFSILKQHVAGGAGLLEELANGIAGNVKERFPFITGQRITIRKAHPPIEGFDGSVSVTLQKTYA